MRIASRNCQEAARDINQVKNGHQAQLLGSPERYGISISRREFCGSESALLAPGPRRVLGIE